jgi:hypothetical protein
VEVSSDNRMLARIDSRSRRLMSLMVDAAGTDGIGRTILAFDPDLVDIEMLNPTALAALADVSVEQSFSGMQHNSSLTIYNWT